MLNGKKLKENLLSEVINDKFEITSIISPWWCTGWAEEQHKDATRAIF